MAQEPAHKCVTNHLFLPSFFLFAFVVEYGSLYLWGKISKAKQHKVTRHKEKKEKARKWVWFTRGDSFVVWNQILLLIRQALYGVQATWCQGFQLLTSGAL